MVPKSITILSLIALLIAGCTAASPSPVSPAAPTIAPTLDFTPPTPASLISPTSDHPPSPVASPSTNPDQQIVLNLAFSVVKAIKDKDMITLSQAVHPQLGLRFSPYSYVLDSHQVFPADKVGGLMDDSTVYLWGNYDGTGEPINLTFADYYAKFIYDVDFADAPQISLNHRLGTGNSLDNTQEFYPGSLVVEFYYPGFDPQYGGMDWRSLRLVFMQADQTWYLAGIIHDQWTT
jgi:hypothetical protein